jgi:hypothetical protein
MTARTSRLIGFGRLVHIGFVLQGSGRGLLEQLVVTDFTVTLSALDVLGVIESHVAHHGFEGQLLGRFFRSLLGANEPTTYRHQQTRETSRKASHVFLLAASSHTYNLRHRLTGQNRLSGSNATATMPVKSTVFM